MPLSQFLEMRLSQLFFDVSKRAPLLYWLGPLSHSLDSLSSQWVGPYAYRSTHSLDGLSSEWASFPFTGFFGDYMGQAHWLDKVSSERARPILAFGPSSERFRTVILIIKLSSYFHLCKIVVFFALNIQAMILKNNLYLLVRNSKAPRTRKISCLGQLVPPQQC